MKITLDKKKKCALRRHTCCNSNSFCERFCVWKLRNSLLEPHYVFSRPAYIISFFFCRTAISTYANCPITFSIIFGSTAILLQFVRKLKQSACFERMFLKCTFYYIYLHDGSIMSESFSSCISSPQKCTRGPHRQKRVTICEGVFWI